MKEIFKKIDFKSGFLYFALIELEMILTATFLTMLIVTPIRFIINEPGTSREIVEFFAFLLVEMLFKFFMFFAFFKNNRNLTFKQFCTNYSFTFVLRLVFALFTSFASFSAGMPVGLLGILLASTFIDKDIVTTQQVPVMLYILIFVLFEALTILVVYFSSKLAIHQREKTRKELHNEHKNN